MCGIFGYIGTKDPLSMCLSGLKLLEYRGYDSSGVAGLFNGKLLACKEAGKIANLEKKIRLQDLKLDLVIGHTRWATHGQPNHLNAHPHFDTQSTMALVHNGIIENYNSLREELIYQGKVFSSETDTEVIVQLLAKNYEDSLLKALQKTLLVLKGSFAIALIHKDYPNQIFAATRESPLCIGFNDTKSEIVISSDPNAFFSSTSNVVYLQNNEIASIRSGCLEVFDLSLREILSKPEHFNVENVSCTKGIFEHFLLKEIHEQPLAVQKTLSYEQTIFPEEELRSIRNIKILGCGTSSHAGQMAGLLFEEFAHLPTSVEIASEARYRTSILSKDTLVIAISQSGETADTLAAMREVKKQGCKILGICNVKNSTLSREADITFFLNAGPEISVCSSKAFTSQIASLALFSLHIAQVRGICSLEKINWIQELKKTPHYIQEVLNNASEIQKIAKKYASFNDFFFIGRRYMVPTALEAALKLKEISYVNANGYPAGELKHGPIALIHANFPVVAFCANLQTQDKIASNMMEVKARGAPVLAFAPKRFKVATSLANDVIWLPDAPDPIATFASSVAGQLFAYYIAKERGCDIDQPRNLAKSVTVE